MTDRLYYADSYLKKFTAQVLEFRDGAARLDRSAFYPTSGGQPYDTGTLGGYPVRDVFVADDGEVWHRIDGTLAPGAQVTGEIDWERRFDHMQQHAGEHMLAGAIFKKLNGFTIGLHLGAQTSTIDVSLRDGATRVSQETLYELEDAVNMDIQKDLPIRAWFPKSDEMARLPLRKPPTVREHIRVVLIGDDQTGECVACGGTHPSSSGQIGLLRILDARPSKGKMRVTFVCGMRALRDARMRANAAGRAAERLSASVAALPEAVETVLEKARSAKAELEREIREQAVCRAESLWDAAETIGGWRVVTDSREGLDVMALKDVASALTAHPDTVALLESAQSDGNHLVLFARSAGEGPHMGRLLSDALKDVGGRGGGRPDFAQGGAPVSGAVRQGAWRMNTVDGKPE